MSCDVGEVTERLENKMKQIRTVTSNMNIIHSRPFVFSKPHHNTNDFIHSERLTNHSVRGFDPGRSRWIFSERKNPEYDFFRKASKTVGPVS